MNLSIKKINLNFFCHRLLACHQQVTIFLGLVAILGAGLFLYKNFYKSLTNTEAIRILKEKVIGVKIDTGLYIEVIENLNNKKTPPEIDPEEIKNPFLPYAAKGTINEKEE